MTTILVLGSSGLLGSTLCPFLKNNGYNIISAGRRDDVDYKVDINDAEKLKSLIKEVNPQQIINLIALTNVDYCEKNVSSAFEVNSNLLKIINEVTKYYSKKKNNIHLVHISTDHIYSGEGPHKEEKPKPVNVYGLTKLLGEYMTDIKNTTILRTNFFGKSKTKERQSFSDWIVYSNRKKEKINLFDDVYFSAINMNTLCDYILNIIENKITGIYNVGSKNGISKAEFGIALAENVGLNKDYILIGKISDLQTKTIRPYDMRMNVERIERKLKIKCPDIYDEIKKTAKEYKDE
jgi:dTDP-4-dehydrorhamnose reductase